MLPIIIIIIIIITIIVRAAIYEDIETQRG